jgi:hypothetical protein
MAINISYEPVSTLGQGSYQAGQARGAIREQEYNRELNRMAINQGYDLQKMDLGHAMDLENAAVGQNYKLDTMEYGDALDSRTMARKNYFEKNLLSFQDDLSREKERRAFDLWTKQEAIASQYDIDKMQFGSDLALRNLSVQKDADYQRMMDLRRIQGDIDNELATTKYDYQMQRDLWKSDFDRRKALELAAARNDYERQQIEQKYQNELDKTRTWTPKQQQTRAQLQQEIEAIQSDPSLADVAEDLVAEKQARLDSMRPQGEPQYSVEDRIKQSTWRDPYGNFWTVDKEGTPKMVKKADVDKVESPMDFATYSRVYSDVVKSLAKKDDDGNLLPPDPAKVQTEISNRMRFYKNMFGAGTDGVNAPTSMTQPQQPAQSQMGNFKKGDQVKKNGKIYTYNGDGTWSY